MKLARGYTLVLLFMAFATLACNLLTPSRPTPAPAATAFTNADATAPAPVDPTPAPTDGTNVEPSAVPATAVPTSAPTLTPTPTTERLELEVLQTQTWVDRLGDARINVLFRNPYEFPVSLGNGARATLRNSAGAMIRDGGLYFLDGISGGAGFLLPGEIIAANACFTCLEAKLSEEWASVEVVSSIQDATGTWNYSTEVEPSVGAVAFDGDSPLFDISGTVTNNSGGSLQRISVRVTVFDQEGKLVGAAEASAWDVGAAATANFSSYGIGQTPAGEFTYEVTAVGVNY